MIACNASWTWPAGGSSSTTVSSQVPSFATDVRGTSRAPPACDARAPAAHPNVIKQHVVMGYAAPPVARPHMTQHTAAQMPFIIRVRVRLPVSSSRPTARTKLLVGGAHSIAECAANPSHAHSRGSGRNLMYVESHSFSPTHRQSAPNRRAWSAARRAAAKNARAVAALPDRRHRWLHLRWFARLRASPATGVRRPRASYPARPVVDAARAAPRRQLAPVCGPRRAPRHMRHIRAI